MFLYVHLSEIIYLGLVDIWFLIFILKYNLTITIKIKQYYVGIKHIENVGIAT